MAWAPEFNVFDFRSIGQNLLDYVETNQDDAIVWAGGSGLKVFEKFYTNASGRLQTIFPSLMILDQTTATDLEEAMTGGVEMTLEATMTGPDADGLVSDPKIYAMALESMLVNIPSGALLAGAMEPAKAYIMEMQTVFDIIRGYTAAATPYLQ